MRSFRQRDSRVATDIRLKDWYDRRRAEIVRSNRPRLIRAAMTNAKHLHFAIMLPLVRLARLTPDNSLIGRYYSARSAERR